MNKEFENRFWSQALDPTAIIINGNCFHIGEENEKGFRGFSGSKFIIKMTKTTVLYDKDEIITTTNLWHQGKIPQRIIETLNVKDNAVFVDECDYAF